MLAQGSNIIIEHVGESDKSLPTIIIRYKVAEQGGCYNYVKASMKSNIIQDEIITDINYVEVFFHSLKPFIKEIDTTKRGDEFGSFKIKIYQYEDCNNKCEVLLDRNTSIKFFYILIKNIKEKNQGNDQELLKALENLIRRINY
ncbi:MAG TPA: hypothetical protein VHK91_09105 [Flavisolibacter sp.]|nr:hypothetical protein [Flavisolibacter sp.]